MARKRRDERRSDAELLAEFLGAIDAGGRSTHSIGAYRRDLQALLAALPGPLREVRPADLRDHFRQRLEAGASPSTINRAIGATRSFCRFSTRGVADWSRTPRKSASFRSA